MASFLERLKNLDKNIDRIASEYLNMQLTVMMLQHAGQVRINSGHVEHGRIILGFVERMRKAVNDVWQTCEQSLGEEMQNASNRIGYERILYSSHQ